MALLVVSPNLISLLLGWDGLGVTSFLLVIYFNSHKSLNAGMVTAITNRIGDCLILVAIALLLPTASKNLFLYGDGRVLSGALSLLLVVAATTKRAQMPFSA